MKPRRAELAQIQRWMQSVIMHPGGVAEGVESPQARAHLEVPLAELESVVARSRTLDSQQRLEIYVDAYYERLLECLREEFSVTRQAVGDGLFDGLAFGYLQYHPSTSYTLYHLGRRFAEYLADSRLHAAAAPADASETWADFIVELAAFERLQREVFDAEGTERLPPFDVPRSSSMAPGEWGSVRLATAPCLRLCTYAHPVHRYWEQARHDEQPTLPAAERCWLAVNRRDYVIERIALTLPQFTLLRCLCDGESLASAIDKAAADEPDLLAHELGAWFAGWTQRRFFTGVL